jgi:hypothetical protein
MATRTHKLVTTDLQIRNAKPEDKKLILGNGISIEISQTGRKTTSSKRLLDIGEVC